MTISFFRGCFDPSTSTTLFSTISLAARATSKFTNHFFFSRPSLFAAGVVWLFVLFAGGCGSPTSSSQTAPAKLAYEILATRDHDASIFTQGMVLQERVVTETSGLYGKSFVTQYDADSGHPLKRVALPTEIFAEGITLFHGHFYVLTWHAEKAFVLRADTLQMEKTLTYSGEGWGITHDSRHLITSDGSDTLSFRNPVDFNVEKTLPVTDGQQSWSQLNELEYAQGYIWANVWQAPFILAIDPSDGRVMGVADLSELDRANNRYPGESVLNGIAFDPAQQAYWITGKWWPKRYLVRFVLPSEVH